MYRYQEVWYISAGCGVITASHLSRLKTSVSETITLRASASKTRGFGTDLSPDEPTHGYPHCRTTPALPERNRKNPEAPEKSTVSVDNMPVTALHWSIDRLGHPGGENRNNLLGTASFTRLTPYGMPTGHKDGCTGHCIGSGNYQNLAKVPLCPSSGLGGRIFETMPPSVKSNISISSARA